MAVKKHVYLAPPYTQVGTSVDPMGLPLLIEFDENGEYVTTDPGIVAVLDRLTRDPDHPVKKKEKE